MNYDYTLINRFFTGIAAGLLLQLTALAQSGTPAMLPSDTASISQLLDLQLDQSQLRKNMDNTKVAAASKSKENTASAPGLLTVMDKHELSAFGGLSLVDVLNRAIGTYILSSHLLPTNSISLRGDLPSPTTGHVLILIDGRPLRESVFGGVYLPVLTAFPVESLERIEIIRGPGSVLYGTGAYSGVINLVTARESKTGTRVAAKGGSFGTLATSVSQTLAGSDWHVNATGQLLTQKGWKFTAADEEGTSGSMDYGQQHGTLLLNATYKKFTFRSFYAHTQHDVLGEDARWSVEEEVHALKTRRSFADIGYQDRLSQKWDFSVNATYNGLGQAFGGDEGQFHYFSNDALLEMTHFVHFSPKLNLTAGGLANYTTGGGLNEAEDANEVFIQPYASFNWGSYAVADYSPVKHLKLIAGGQYNQLAGVSRGHFSPRLGAIVHLTADLGVKTLFGEAFRAGSASERHILVENELYGDPGLKPEKVTTGEIQLFYQKPSYQFTAGYFSSKQHDEIELVAYADGAEKYQNQHSRTFHGVELEGKALPVQTVTLTGNLSYQTNRNSEGIRNTTPVPNLMAKGGVAYAGRQGFSVGVYNAYFAKPADVINMQTGMDAGEQRKIANPVPKAFHLLSLHLTADVNKLLKLRRIPHVELSGYGQNLLDQKVYQPEFSRRHINSLPAMGGRALYASIAVQL